MRSRPHRPRVHAQLQSWRPDPAAVPKAVRLQEARKILLGEHLDATSTAFRVGYNDASHFNRDYKRHFGFPPMNDVEQTRETAVNNGVGAD